MVENKKPDVLNKPVHFAVLKPSYIQELKLQEGGVIKKTPEAAELPKQEKPKKKSKKFNPFQGVQFDKNTKSVTEQAKLRTHLRVLHDSYPPLPPEQVPPCDTCKASPCCSAFVVAITEDEYNSGLYGDYAVKLTQEQAKQVRGKMLLPITVTVPTVYNEEETQHFLEGRVGEPCPFLEGDGTNTWCGIYEDRPLVCRAYTCVDDPRITQAMRDGEE